LTTAHARPVATPALDNPHANAPAVALTLTAGQPWPMGASATATGINFCVFSAHATLLELCVFDSTGQVQLARLPLPAQTGDVWHGHLAGAQPGLVYGFRAHGSWRPERGYRFNPHKLLLDPYARCIVHPPGGFDWRGAHYGADQQHPLHMDTRDNAVQAFKAQVVHSSFDWLGDAAPRTPLAHTVIYEAHVKSLTRQLPGVPEAQRGTYAGLASPAALAHFKRLGVTAISLLPVQHILDEGPLADRGLRNHWGYNTLGFFCPDPRYAATATPLDEFKTMVQRLHAQGLEVLLDVVYNHTPEGDERGPTLSWRGLCNSSYYRLQDGQPQRYDNFSGCGNTLDIRHPRVLQMVLDSLRYWVEEMHVDGFRFDLAPTLGRASPGFEVDGPFFKAVQQDPVLQRVKLIAEPWDIGPGGYQVGQFPRGWLEWNDRFRDTSRAFWLGGDCTRGEFALRLAGSSDLFQARRRSPLESVNYIVSHDGFTLADLVSYDLRHNHANGENNRDGHGHNLSWNCGWEGPTLDPDVLQRRARLQRALLATVLLAQGTPMLAAGDELGHSQGGNNNPYCQDNPTTWINWAGADQALIDFTAHVLALRRRLQPLAPRWYTGLPDAHGQHDLTWLRRTGQAMEPEHWQNRGSRIMGAWIGAPGAASTPVMLLINGRDMDATFVLPPGAWLAELDTTVPNGQSTWQSPPAGATPTVFNLQARSVVLLRQVATAATATATATATAAA
jgi:glycogen debranching enzyme